MTRYKLERDGLEIAIELAEASTAGAFYGSNKSLTPDDIATAMAPGGNGPVWFAWTGTKDDALYSALTGNGPTSKANARFFANARDIVLELAGALENQRRLDAGRFELMEDARAVLSRVNGGNCEVDDLRDAADVLSRMIEEKS